MKRSRINIFSISFKYTFLLFFISYNVISGQNPKTKPNIVLILSDDAGYADFSFMSSRFIKTPNIDRIANEGAKFTNAYVTGAVCAPSRAGLLTGINQAEFGNVGNFIQGVKYNIPKEEYGIPQNIKLIGDYLKPLGYSTGIVGKWHEGFSKSYHPRSRGFDYFWGFLWGSSPYFTGMANKVEENGKRIAPDSIVYMTDAIGKKSIEFIQKNKGKPFFLYVSFNAVHGPLQAKPEDIEKFKDQFANDPIKLQNAAMTYCLDENVGRILKTLEANKLLENTIIVFANDNGGQHTELHADNFPLKGMKGDAWEGGFRVPFAVRWPSKIKEGLVSNIPVSTLDLLPTFLTAANGNLLEQKQLKGIDLIKLLDEKYSKKNNLAERKFYWLFGKNKGAIRQGKWKMVFLPNAAPALYNLDDDIGETTDLSSQNRLIKATLQKEYITWLNGLPPPRYYSL